MCVLYRYTRRVLILPVYQHIPACWYRAAFRAPLNPRPAPPTLTHNFHHNGLSQQDKYCAHPEPCTCYPFLRRSTRWRIPLLERRSEPTADALIDATFRRHAFPACSPTQPRSRIERNWATIQPSVAAHSLVCVRLYAFGRRRLAVHVFGHVGRTICANCLCHR